MAFFSITETDTDLEINEKLRLFYKECAKAEEILKKSEFTELEGLAFPSVNELRYAAKHLSLFFNSIDR